MLVVGHYAVNQIYCYGGRKLKPFIGRKMSFQLPNISRYHTPITIFRIGLEVWNTKVIYQ